VEKGEESRLPIFGGKNFFVFLQKIAKTPATGTAAMDAIGHHPGCN
jgi:hypothetical protein